MKKTISIICLGFIGLFSACQKEDDLYADFYTPVYKAERYYYDDEPKKILTHVYEYNKDGYAIIVNCYYGELITRTVYLYYDLPSGVVNKIAEKNRVGTEVYHFPCTFNSNGQLVSNAGYTYGYDANGLLISKIGWGDTIQYMYENNRLAKEIVNYLSNDILVDHYNVYTYNQAGDYDTVKTFYSDTLNSFFAYEYSYSPKTVKMKQIIVGRDYISTYVNVFDEYNRPINFYTIFIDYSEKFNMKPMLMGENYEMKFFGMYKPNYSIFYNFIMQK